MSDIRRLSTLTGGSAIPAVPYIAPKIARRTARKTPKLRAVNAAISTDTRAGCTLKNTISTPHTVNDHITNNKSIMMGMRLLRDTFDPVWGNAEIMSMSIRWSSIGNRPTIIITHDTITSSEYDNTASLLVIRVSLNNDQMAITHIATIVRALSNNKWADDTLCVLPSSPVQPRTITVRGQYSYVITTGLHHGCTRKYIQKSTHDVIS